MNSYAALLAPLALLLPSPAGLPVAGDIQLANSGEQSIPNVEDSAPQPAPGWLLLSEAFRIPKQSQVRIQRTVTVRISPRSAPAQSELLASLPQAEIEKRFEAKKMGKCVALDGIAGVQVDRDNRLLLFMRDRQIVRADLDKKCSARDFYSGFYVEQHKDGDICTGRDDLQSRVGSTCQVTKFRRLVPNRP